MSAEKEHIELLAQARSGDRAGMGDLAGMVWERLYPFVFRITLSHDTTEDVVQETLLAMIRRIESLREPERFWPWMYRIAYAKIQDVFRRRRLRTSIQTCFLQRQYRADDARDGRDNPVDAKIREETLQQVAAAVEQLKTQHRDVLRLRYYEDLPYAEIASRTRTTPQRARVRFHRAKESLRQRLHACCA
jgi:RNA polymerase sigma factor (sigma-70 family)